MLSKAHHSKRETNRKKAIPSVTSIKDNANRNISHSGTCTGLKRKWIPIASDRDIAQLVRIAPRFRSGEPGTRLRTGQKRRKIVERKRVELKGVWRGERALLADFLLFHPVWSSQLFDLRALSSTDVPVLLLNQPISVPLQIPPSVKQMLRRNSSFTSARTQSCINCTSK